MTIEFAVDLPLRHALSSTCMIHIAQSLLSDDAHSFAQQPDIECKESRRLGPDGQAGCLRNCLGSATLDWSIPAFRRTHLHGETKTVSDE